MGLKSVLGRRDILALAFGAMIGWGWVVLSGTLIRQAGTLGSMTAFLMGAILVAFVGLTYAELTSAMPRAGGELAFTYRALGPTLSWICGWALILAYLGVCAFESVAIVTVLNYLLPGFQFGFLFSIAGSDVHLSSILVGGGAALGVGWINWRGIQTSARLQLIATAGLLLVGASFFVGSNLTGNTSNLAPHFTGWTGILRAAMLTPFLMIGFDIIPQTSEEARLPRREIGRVLLISIAMATGWYLLVQWGVGLSLDSAARESSRLVTADAASSALRFPQASSLLVLGGFLGILTSWNAFFVGATRLVFGMARAQMLPSVFSRLHPRRHTPSAAILFLTACTLPAPFLGQSALVWLANAASLAAVAAFLLVSISFLILRRRNPEMERPYRVRHWRLVGTVAALVSMAFICLYLPFSPSALLWPQEWMVLLLWVALGAVIFGLHRYRQGAIDRDEQAKIILGPYLESPSSTQHS